MLLEFQRDFVAAIAAPAEGPMRVYRNTVLSGCVDALRANYPVVARLLGDDMFDAIAAEHSSACPPRKPVLALYGARFPEWLEEQPWVVDLPYVPDVARVERSHIESLFAADAPPLAPADVAGPSDWLTLCLPLHPATRFDWLSTPAPTIWEHQHNDEQSELEPEWEPQGILFTRPELEVIPTPIGRAAHRFLFGIRLGESVGDAAIAACTLYPDTQIGPLFAALVTAGAFAAPSQRSLS